MLLRLAAAQAAVSDPHRLRSPHIGPDAPGSLLRAPASSLTVYRSPFGLEGACPYSAG